MFDPSSLISGSFEIGSYSIPKPLLYIGFAVGVFVLVKVGAIPKGSTKEASSTTEDNQQFGGDLYLSTFNEGLRQIRRDFGDQSLDLERRIATDRDSFKTSVGEQLAGFGVQYDGLSSAIGGLTSQISGYGSAITELKNKPSFTLPEYLTYYEVNPKSGNPVKNKKIIKIGSSSDTNPVKTKPKAQVSTGLPKGVIDPLKPSLLN